MRYSVTNYTKFDERDPFVQLIFRSVAIATVMVFVVALAIEWTRPELRVPLFVPFGVALFVGSLGCQVELKRKQYVIAVVWVAAAILFLPMAAWLCLAAARVPYDATEAKFIPLIPQVLTAPALFIAARKRFEAGQRSGHAG